jgi:chromosomal replication initiator protein
MGLPFNPNFTFDSFVVGACNRFAHGAALDVARHPGRGNPLFVYGGVGVGKTHLLHAIGNSLLQRDAGIRVVIATSEQFTADMIDCIKSARMPMFSRHYRSADALLLDDVQFFGNKGHTQEELTHTLNELHTNQKQIVLASDALPADIPGLIERLRSRFEGALLADIQDIDLETKMAIASRKAVTHAISLNDEVRAFIALHTPSDVRSLEGAILRLKAFSTTQGVEVTLDIAKHALSGIVRATPQPADYTVDQIRRAVAREFQLSAAEASGKRRSRRGLLAQHVTMYLIRELRNDSLGVIGKAFGGRHHTTVLYAIDKIASARRTDPECDALVQRILDQLADHAPRG